jgi:riboflavin synthase
VARWKNTIAEVAVIPYTYQNTNIRDRKSGDAVNLEGDVLGKYVERYLETRGAALALPFSVTLARLQEEGF